MLLLPVAGLTNKNLNPDLKTVIHQTVSSKRFDWTRDIPRVLIKRLDFKLCMSLHFTFVIITYSFTFNQASAAKIKSSELPAAPLCLMLFLATSARAPMPRPTARPGGNTQGRRVICLDFISGTAFNSSSMQMAKTANHVAATQYI